MIFLTGFIRFILSFVCYFIMNRLAPEQWAQNKIVTDPFFQQAIVEIPLHPQKVPDAPRSERTIGPYFSKMKPATMLQSMGNTIEPRLMTFSCVSWRMLVDVDETWFQQDGGTCHTVNETINLLKETIIRGHVTYYRRGHVT